MQSDQASLFCVPAEKTRATFFSAITLIFLLTWSTIVLAQNIPSADSQPGSEGSIGEQRNFDELLQERIKNNEFDCSNFNALDEAVCIVYQEAKFWSTEVHSKIFQIAYSIGAMNYVQTNISTARFGLIARGHGSEFIAPGSDAAVCIDLGYGICGNHTAVFLAMTERVGIHSRPVQFFYNSDNKRLNHIAAEVWVDGQWRYLDPTWGAFWSSDEENPIFSIASAQQILQQPKNLHRYLNRAAPIYLVVKHIQDNDPFEYFKKTPSVVFGYNDGVVNIGTPAHNTGLFSLSDIPNYIGDNVSDKAYKGIAYEFPTISGEKVFGLSIQGKAGCSNESKICVNGECKPIDTSSKDLYMAITARDANKIHIQSTDDVCYVVFSEIKASNVTSR